MSGKSVGADARAEKKERKIRLRKEGGEFATGKRGWERPGGALDR